MLQKQTVDKNIVPEGIKQLNTIEELNCRLEIQTVGENC